VIAGEQAPGTVAYLQAMEAVTAIDDAQLADYRGGIV